MDHRNKTKIGIKPRAQYAVLPCAVLCGLDSFFLRVPGVFTEEIILFSFIEVIVSFL